LSYIILKCGIPVQIRTFWMFRSFTHDFMVLITYPPIKLFCCIAWWRLVHYLSTYLGNSLRKVWMFVVIECNSDHECWRKCSYLIQPRSSWLWIVPYLHLMMETDPVSKTLYFKKLKKMDKIQNNSHVCNAWNPNMNIE
jgi:hypothetical protein